MGFYSIWLDFGNGITKKDEQEKVLGMLTNEF